MSKKHLDAEPFQSEMETLYIWLLGIMSITRSQLQSARHHLVVVPRYNRSTYGRCAFSVAGPMTWNSLTDSLRDPSLSIDSFRRQLKHICFIIKPCVFSKLEIFLLMCYINLHFTHLLTYQYFNF